MKTATAALLLVLAAACSPTEKTPAPLAQQPVAAVSTIAYPQVAEGADDGKVYYDYY
jgi:hypothetical protein